MPRIVLTRTYKHEQIEFPEGTPHPEGRRGGGKSSLHLRRNSVRDVTPEELDHIRQAYPLLYSCLEILPESSPRRAKKPAGAQKPAPKKAAPVSSGSRNDGAPAKRTNRRKKASEGEPRGEG